MRKKSEICLDSMTAVKTQINLCCKQQYEVAPQNEMEVMEAQQSDGTSAVCKLTKTRKLCYRKDDRAMRPIYRCPENF